MLSILFFTFPQRDLFKETNNHEGEEHQAQAEQDGAVDAFSQAEFHGGEYRVEGGMTLCPVVFEACVDGSHDRWRGEYQRILEDADELDWQGLFEYRWQRLIECRDVGGGHDGPDGDQANALTELAEEDYCRSGLSDPARHGVLDGDGVER